jgi:hypothetical protein
MHKGVNKLDTKEIVESLLLFVVLGVAVILGMCL